ncbi:hypothetical protein D3C80_2008520 [compost metagenome]
MTTLLAVTDHSACDLMSLSKGNILRDEPISNFSRKRKALGSLISKFHNVEFHRLNHSGKGR